MARILIGTVPVVGHVNTPLPLARALVERGHEVCWSTSERYRKPIEATGSRFEPAREMLDFHDFRREDFAPGGERLQGVAALKIDIKHGFIDNGVIQLRHLESIAKDFRPDLVLGDICCIGAMFFAERTGTPRAVLNVIPMGLNSQDTAPSGLGLLPNASPLGRLRNRALNWAVENAIFRDTQKYWNRVRADHGLPPTNWVIHAVGATAELYLQPSIPGFEYPRSDLPANVRFIGMLPTVAPSGWSPPAWWRELDGGKPVVHVTQGTVANTNPELLKPALEGLADEDVLVVVTTGGRDPGELGLSNPPANARVERYFSYPELLPKVSALVTNGGYGGVQTALSHGVPLVVAGTTEDKPEVASRVQWSGAGINLKTAAPKPSQVRAAVRAVLDDPRYRERARALQAEYARYDSLALGTELIERLAAKGPKRPSP